MCLSHLGFDWYFILLRVASGRIRKVFGRIPQQWKMQRADSGAPMRAKERIEQLGCVTVSIDE